MKYIISRTVDKAAVYSVAVERSFWNMSGNIRGITKLTSNTLNQLHEQGEAISPILKDAWCLDVNSLSTDVFLFVFSGLFDSARMNLSAVTNPNPTPLPLWSINHRAFHFFMRTQESLREYRGSLNRFSFSLFHRQKKNKTKQKTSIQKKADELC